MSNVDVLARHYWQQRGMSAGSPDTCACGWQTFPAAGPEDVAERRARAFAAHQVAVLAEVRPRKSTGAGLMRDRCSFTSRDMGASWSEAFTYAIVLGWDDEVIDDGVMGEIASRHGWDATLVAFLRDAHARFNELADKTDEDTYPVVGFYPKD